MLGIKIFSFDFSRFLDALPTKVLAGGSPPRYIIFSQMLIGSNLFQVRFYTRFEINDQTGESLSEKDMMSLHYQRIGGSVWENLLNNAFHFFLSSVVIFYHSDGPPLKYYCKNLCKIILPFFIFLLFSQKKCERQNN